MNAGRLIRAARSPALDLVLAVVLGCYAALDALHTTDFPQPDGVSAALVAVSAAFLALRRVRPLTALTGALGGLAAVYLALGHYEAGAAVLIGVIATYSAGAYGRNLPFTVAVVFAFGVTTGLRQPAAEALADMAWSWAVLALALGVGLTARRLRGQSQSAQRQVQQMQQEQQALAEAAARQERQRIARELHDIISHGLGVVVLQAGAAEQILDRDPGKAREAMRLIRATGQEAIAELGTLVALIRDEQPPGRDPQPTLRDVERLAATTRSAGLAVTVQTEGQPRDLPASVELNAYRVIQEGLTNALKHAPGSTVQVVLRYHPRGLDVEVRDDGTDTAGGPGSRRGLAGLRERAAVFGGQFEAGRDPRGGWKVRASFPRRAMIRVLLADDQAVVRAGLRTILESEPDMQVIGEAADGAEALSLSAALGPDVVMMDIRMPVLDGIQATHRLTESPASVRVLVLTTYGLDEYVYEALRAGAAGFLLKTDPPDRIIDAVRIVNAGDALLGPHTTRRLIERFLASPPPHAPRPAALDTLTDRELEVMREVAHGLTNREIAERLYIGEGTVKTHVARILTKLGLRDRVQVVVYAYEHGITHPGDNNPPPSQ